MTQFSDLSDDCLIEVLDRLSAEDLFKIQRGNKRLKRLANVKMQTNIKAIKLIGSEMDFSDCTHLGSIRRDQVLFLNQMFKEGSRTLQDSSKRLLFLSVLTKCANVKSIDFDYCALTGDVLLEVVRRCPELECIKLVYSRLNEDEWSQVFDKIGHKILHFVKARKKGGFSSEAGVLKTIAAKCNNIKRIDWVIDYLLDLTNNYVAAFKMLPKDCFVKFECFYFEDNVVIEDVFNELKVRNLNWSALDGRRYNRLSSLKLYFFEYNFNLPIRGVRFPKLKALDVIHGPSLNDVNLLLASQFPLLEEFGFNSFDITEAKYDALFQKMALVKKLTIHWEISNEEEDQNAAMQLPQAAIHHLKNLEIIVLEIFYVPNNWQPDDFLDQLEQYVDGINSLKKLTVTTRLCGCIEWEKTVIKEVERMKAKQNRVEVDLDVRNYQKNDDNY